MLQDKDYDIINNDDEYKYLVKMPMDSVSEENVAKLLKEHGDKEAELERIKMTTIQQMWLTDLQLLEKAYQDYLKERNAIDDSSNTTNKKKISSSKVLVKSNKKKMTLLVEEDSEVVNKTIKNKIVFEEDE
jgi:DNA topoisomerase-2